MLPAFVITLLGHKASMLASQRCVESIAQTGSMLSVQIFDAVTPETLQPCKWTWPESKRKKCPHTQLTLIAYKNADIRRRIACAQSHFNLWQLCQQMNQTICVLEHDAVFTRKFEHEDFEGGVLALNDPAGATFCAKKYDQALINGVNEIPWVTDQDIPQGLPGNSAYLIKPWAAKELIEQQNQIGWWPNDAIMCRQLFPWLRIVKPYYTCVQNIESTTRY